jgi:hypothetical protein
MDHQFLIDADAIGPRVHAALNAYNYQLNATPIAGPLTVKSSIFELDLKL